MSAISKTLSKLARGARKPATLTQSRPLATVQDNNLAKMAATMPPGHKATVAQLETFTLPERVTGSKGDIAMGKALVDAWRRDGILQVSMNDKHKAFFAKPPAEKAAFVDSQSYAGYIASGEEITDGIADYSEIFTVTKDLDLAEPRVRAKWPCHGPAPWPDYEMKQPMTTYMEFPPTHNTNGKGKEGRGIGSHTDYGLLVIAAQDDVGGLFIRPPYDGEHYANWEKSAAGMKEDDEKWHYVPPVPNVFTVFPGDIMQYITNSYLPSTPHKVGLNTRDRFAFAYFHEPSFQAVAKPLPGYDVG
ncbi:hypothetical protein COL922a_009580 [Colletotrichum nupharicola]|nr:hypothetical protein COL922a_009580 [Colletotrichum nupharicola]